VFLCDAFRGSVETLQRLGWRRRIKKSVRVKNSWNFVLNFREQMANDKHYPKGKTKNPKSKGKQL